MDAEDTNCDAKLQIVNRTRKYNVSKKLICSSVPYFEKMFCCDLLESKKNQVVLDFDEHAFESIIDWVHSESFSIQMDYVIDFYEAADYLMINEPLFQPCLSYFNESFTIEHLPVVLKKVTKVSKLINLGSIENFICRHFLTITNARVFLDYPVETIEAILRLDLMIYSEYQVFESIMKWVNKSVDSRKDLLPQLLNCVRWSFMDFDVISKIQDNHLIKTLSNLDSIFKSSYIGFNRCKQNFFVSIHERASILRLKVFDNDCLCCMIGDFTQDDSISLGFVNGEHNSDILFDSGTKGIRIDWTKKTFRWLNSKFICEIYYKQLRKFILDFSVYSTGCYLEDKRGLPFYSQSYKDLDHLILESNGKFIVIGRLDYKWIGLFPATDRCWFNYDEKYGRFFRATVLDDVVYILTKDLEFIQFNYETKYFSKSEPFKDEKWFFNDLILTSHQTNDNKVILVNKSSGVVHYYCINKKKWIEKYRIMNVNLLSSSPAPDNNLIAFTSTFLPIKVIEPLYEQSDN